ncbi:MAG UNVERIFIED_CONTAM: hypothetical protein LVR18_04280 [Planctomycetaceae bacterium]|jgi:hypothetical protein
MGHPSAAAVQFLADFSGRRPRILWMKDLPVVAAEDLGLNERTIDRSSAKRFKPANDP